jgi:cell division septation protein DedD
MIINQSTQNLTPKLSRFWLHLFLGFTSFFAYPFIISFISQNAIALADTPITVDPYNDSNFEPLSIETQSVKTNSSSNNNKALPTDNQSSVMGEILINGNPTPIPPTIVSGSLIKSNQTLPQIPPLSEPFRREDRNNEINENLINNENITGKAATLSLSISPFDQTPEENQPNLLSTKIVKPPTNLNSTPRSINLSPNVSPSINNPPANAETSETLSPQSVLGKRRSLNEILVFSTPSENNSNTSNITPTTSVTQPVSLTTKSDNIHKVLVKVNNSIQESQVKSIYPQAFRTNLRGQQMLQVGVFSNHETAQEVSNSLKKMGFNTYININN